MVSVAVVVVITVVIIVRIGVVGVVFARVGGGGVGAVLHVRGSEAVKLAAIFGVVDIVFEEKFAHLKEGGAG